MSNPPTRTDAQPPLADADSIKFQCAGCDAWLKVAVAAAGRHVKCPQCGTMVDLLQSPPAGPPEGAERAHYPGAAQAAPPPNSPTAGSPSQPVARPSGLASPGSPFAATAPLAAAVLPSPAVAPAPRPIPDSNLSIARLRLSTPETDTPTKRLANRIVEQIAKIYVGQDELVLGTLVALFSGGHVLIESVPGLGKTLFVRALGRVLGCRFGRIQFTADLMPSDVTGAPIFDMKTQEFRFRPGPVFTQFLLADEINRAPAKTHAALLEIMQEYRVTVDGMSHSLERPFLVLATQNPIESEGTYNLPEAQLDRFMFKIVADYPAADEEAAILKLHSRQVDINERLERDLETVTSPEEIADVMRQNNDVRVDDKLVEYINQLVRLTRQWPQFHLGASPRAGLALMQGARTLAAFDGRDYAVPDDVVQIALPALRHRMILTAEAEVEGHHVDQLLTTLIRSVEVPRL